MLKKRLWHRCFLLNFKNTLFTEHLWTSASVFINICSNIYPITCKYDIFLLREKCPYSEFCWSVFSRIRTKYGEVFSPNAGKYGPKKLWIRTLFTNIRTGYIKLQELHHFKEERKFLNIRDKNMSWEIFKKVISPKIWKKKKKKIYSKSKFFYQVYYLTMQWSQKIGCCFFFFFQFWRYSKTLG